MSLVLSNILLILLIIVNGLNCEKEPSNQIIKKIKTGNLDIETIDNKISLTIRKNDGAKLEATLYTKNPTLPGQRLTIEQDCEKLTTCIQLGNKTHAKIKADPDNEVITINRMIDNVDGKLIDCYRLSEETEWFGGPEKKLQLFPLQNMYFEEEIYLTSQLQNMALVERYWLSSKGVYLYVNSTDPLFIDQNNFKDRNLCFIAKNEKPYVTRNRLTLNYAIGVFSDPKLAHQNAIDRYIGKPMGRPNEIMITHPIWSTWARYKINIDQTIVQKFGNEIIDNGFNNSQLEIDDNWESCYGSAKFDKKKFPDVVGMIGKLKKKGINKITLWIHPFINEDCNDEQESYDYALKKGYFVKNENGNVKTSWWQGKKAAIIDFTNKEAVDWWIGRLKKLQRLGIDSFKFDAGESSWLPDGNSILKGVDSELIPGIYTKNYVEALSKNFDDSIEVRTGWTSQSLSCFVRMIDKDSRWTWNNGLPTLVTTLLQMNLNGYVYVLPDMIGGNGYVDNQLNKTQLPSKELFIRWLQATTFMPALQYSFVPWDYDNETIQISKQYTDLHAQYSPKIIELMKKTIETGAPINPPVWWVDPSNTKAHKINDEYLLGEDILVAPVMEEGATSRDIYLPKGQWKDPRTGKEWAGSILLQKYPAKLDVLPYFIKV